MTHFLASQANEDGFKLEDILTVIRADVIKRCDRIVGDTRDEAAQVLENNIQILQLLSQSIRLAEESTRVLNRSFGPASADENAPRIGTSG